MVVLVAIQESKILKYIILLLTGRLDEGTFIIQRALEEDYSVPWFLFFFWEAEEGNVVSGSTWECEEAECNIWLRKHTWRRMHRNIWRNNGWKLPTLLKAMQLQIHKTQWTSQELNLRVHVYGTLQNRTVNVVSRSVRVGDEMGKGWSQKTAKELGPRELLPRQTDRRVDMTACTCRTNRTVQHIVHLPVNKVKTWKNEIFKSISKDVWDTWLLSTIKEIIFI